MTFRLLDGRVSSLRIGYNGPAYAHPRAVWFVPELPLAGTNKIDRKALVERAAALYKREAARQL